MDDNKELSLFYFFCYNIFKKGQIMKKIFFLILFSSFLFSNTCNLPKNIKKIVNELKVNPNESDFFNNDLANLCVKRISFNDENITWDFTLVWNPEDKGPFYYLPHDDEDAAFDTAVYSANFYGGGFLAVNNNEERIYKGIDPNRNFYKNKYTKNILTIINSFKEDYYPYITLHNNKNGYKGNGGKGTISMLKEDKYHKSFPVKNISNKFGDLADEDNLIYLVGKNVNKKKVDVLNFYGINVIYELVTKKTYDGSLSNYLVIEKNNDHYLNLESEMGNAKIQKKMLDLVISFIDVF